MKIYRAVGGTIDNGCCGAAHFATKREAIQWVKEYYPNDPNIEIDTLTIRNRQDMARYLDDAMGYGG